MSMNVKEMAFEFAKEAHDGQYRKAELEKPSVFHAIDVANLLAKYGFDDNVIAAGYLHDVIEDTDVTEEDIKLKFGDDICSLVMGATEEDKSLRWEDRKLGTINRVKKLDLRHKAIVTCDKISNMQDLRLKFGKEGKEDFSAFSRGKKKKLWYWQEVYKSLIEGENSNLPMFVKLKEDLDEIAEIFTNGIVEYYPDINVFNLDLEESDIARILHYKSSEIFKLNGLLNKPCYVVEIVGGDEKREKLITKLKSYLVLNGFKVGILKDLSVDYRNISTVRVINKLKGLKEKDYDIILVDDSLLSKAIVSEILFRRKKITKRERKIIIDGILNELNNSVDLLVDLSNDYYGEYNKILRNLIKNCKSKELVNVYNKDISIINEDSSMLEICAYVIDDMRNNSLDSARSKVKIRCK